MAFLAIVYCFMPPPCSAAFQEGVAVLDGSRINGPPSPRYGPPRQPGYEPPAAAATSATP
ncbi:hypothetical protein TRIUR3_01128 [Triticum urartu]|uniref:Uncharacterized protein n=1 Tax=Triticum urartu TaxID=4572 RepID=M7YE20_TRIUA|nr:hypothetical protein TRIUR3_01128 [Triticum urartu]